MQIIKLQLSHYNLFCPATGEQILFEDDCNEDAKSLQGYWCDLFFEEPVIKNKKLATAWKKFQQKNKSKYQSDFQMLEDFFLDYPEPNWIVFKIADNNPSSSTAWHILDMNTVK